MVQIGNVPDSESDSAYLHRTLARHDDMIIALTGRMTEVERSVKDLNAVMSKGFTEVTRQLGDMRANAGPGFGPLLSYLVAGAGLIAMCGGAVTVLVMSFVSPDVARLKQQAEALHMSVEAHEKSLREDYRDARRLQQWRILQRLDRLEEIYPATRSRDWEVRVDPEPPSAPRDSRTR